MKEIIFESKHFKCTQHSLILSIPANLFYLTDMALEERTEFLYDCTETFNRVNKLLQQELNKLNDKHFFSLAVA